MKLGLATLTAFVALVATAPAHASVPVPWCGTSSSSVDRLPDATPGYAVHVAYVRAPGAPDRFFELAPRLAGDAAAIDAWWRREDPTRALRFDLFPAPGCASTFGALDITNVELPQGIGGIDDAFQNIRDQLSELGLREPEKAYLAYFDGPTGQEGDERVCGQGAAPSFSRSAIAIVYLDSCGATTSDSLRPIVAVHELVHALGAVSRSAPNVCQGGHVCDSPQDLMGAFLSGAELDEHVLDFARDDYYGHAGGWTDVRSSLFLERLDFPDRAPPTVPTGLRVGDDPSGLVRFSWRPSQDDVGPVTYRVYQDARFVREVSSTAVLLPGTGGIGLYSVRAADSVGHLSAVANARFRPGAGMVDGQGRLVRDTVRPPAIGRVTIRQSAKAVVLTWPAVRDPGGLRGYRIKLGTRTLLVRKPTLTIARSRATVPVSISAVDRAGNIGAAIVVPRSRFR